MKATESLAELLLRKDHILADHEKRMAREKKNKPNKSLVEVLENVLDDEDDTEPCFVCNV